MTAREQMAALVKRMPMEQLLQTYKLAEHWRTERPADDEYAIVSAALFGELSNRIEDEAEFDRLVLGIN